ncbi:MAG: cysteine--tRNA ligase [Actinobacteria bacterium]|nr:cysteine--tRNA ligase [Actinomycetota bacterium]
MAIKVYNTLTRQKEDLVPRDEGKISMYVCGPTVYNYIHIGNARTFLNFDMIRRYLEYSGFDVTFVQNITDIDDKIINRAKEEKTDADAVAAKYSLAFEEDMAALGVRPPDIAPSATEHVAEMVEVVRGLVDKGYAYKSEGDVYFEVAKFPDYGRLSGRSLEEQQVTVQCAEEVERKREPFDFALWKASKPGEPSWESPWGPGRPGWHIECSTMSVKYLGSGFDIHGGGQDLVFPHHENEIAQSEAYSGTRFVQYWLHSGMLNIDREKMSKSIGNIMLLREVLTEHDADTIRMLMLGTHYRSPLSFGAESLAEARASLERIQNCMFNLEDMLGRSAAGEEAPGAGERDTSMMDHFKECERDFREAMDDDFNSAAALGLVFSLVKEINTYVDASPANRSILEEALRLLRDQCGALGLFQGEAEPVKQVEEGPTREQLIELLLQVRQAARENKYYELSDLIRDRLSEMDVRIEDVRDGFRWRYER